MIRVSDICNLHSFIFARGVSFDNIWDTNFKGLYKIQAYDQNNYPVYTIRFSIL